MKHEKQIKALEYTISVLKSQIDTLKSDGFQTQDGPPHNFCKAGEVYDPILKRCVDDIG